MNDWPTPRFWDSWRPPRSQASEAGRDWPGWGSPQSCFEASYGPEPPDPNLRSGSTVSINPNQPHR